MVSGTISLPFRGSFHLSLAVLVHYRSVWVFSLGSWPTQIPTRFSVSRGTWDTATVNIRVKYRAFTFFGWTFQFILLQIFNRILQSRNTPDLRRGLGWSAFARRYLRNLQSLLSKDRFLTEGWFLFLRLLRCFTSARSLPTLRLGLSVERGYPIRTSRINIAFRQLIRAFRSPTRPSSAYCTKAFTLRP